MRKLLIVFGLLGLLLPSQLAAQVSGPNAQRQERVQERVGVVSGEARVVDGDTIIVSGTRIRLEGIDAPETRQICLRRTDGAPVECGRVASMFLASLVSNRDVSCRVITVDRYNRPVGRCSVRNGAVPGGESDLSTAMVAAGMAHAFMARERPDLVALERQAQRSGVGLWATNFERPSDYRRNLRDRTN